MREGGAGAPRPSFLACGWLPVCVCGIAREEGERREEGGGRRCCDDDDGGGKNLTRKSNQNKTKTTQPPHQRTLHRPLPLCCCAWLYSVDAVVLVVPRLPCPPAVLALALFARKPTKPRRFFTPWPRSHTTTHTPHTGTHPTPHHPTAQARRNVCRPPVSPTNDTT